MQAPVLVLNTEAERDQGHKAQLGNIAAAKAVSSIVRTTLGPRSMLKMILDPMGGIVMTNDGNAILREIDVNHPAAKSMIELSRTQDEEVGDGTTSVIILGIYIICYLTTLISFCIHFKHIMLHYTLNYLFNRLHYDVNWLLTPSHHFTTIFDCWHSVSMSQPTACLFIEPLPYPCTTIYKTISHNNTNITNTINNL